MFNVGHFQLIHTIKSIVYIQPWILIGISSAGGLKNSDVRQITLFE